jgi:hypothetical protein
MAGGWAWGWHHPGKDSCHEIWRNNSRIFSWQKLQRKATAHVGLSSQWWWWLWKIWFNRKSHSLPLEVTQSHMKRLFRNCSNMKLSRTVSHNVSSGSIVSDYGLDDRAIGVRSPAGAKDFSSSLCDQTGSGAHPASCPMGTGGPFPGG